MQLIYIYIYIYSSIIQWIIDEYSGLSVLVRNRKLTCVQVLENYNHSGLTALRATTPPPQPFPPFTFTLYLIYLNQIFIFYLVEC